MFFCLRAKPGQFGIGTTQHILSRIRVHRAATPAPYAKALHRDGRYRVGLNYSTRQGRGVLHELETQCVHEEADRWAVLADHNGDEAAWRLVAGGVGSNDLDLPGKRVPRSP